ncbi:MAG: sulfotransferase [Pseudomonadota bacterium]
MTPRSPDARWASPGFVLRRLLRRPAQEPAAFAPALDPGRLARARAHAAAARQGARLRCAFLLGPMPRSGTNFVEGLVAAHPQVAASPLGLREAAVLAEAPRLAPFAAALARRHPSAALEPEAWLGYALAGVLARLEAERPEAALALFKDPHARGLARLPAILPDAIPIVVLRDGRRTLDSHLRTWPPRGAARWLGRSFADRCAEWALANQAALDFAAAEPRAVVVRYEAAAADPQGAAARLAAALGLPPSAAQGEAVARLPVLGSSTHSRTAQGVDWAPRPAAPDFDPAARPLDWPAARERVFRRIAGEAQARLDREAPVRSPHAPRAAA